MYSLYKISFNKISISNKTNLDPIYGPIDFRSGLECFIHLQELGWILNDQNSTQLCDIYCSTLFVIPK